MFLAYDLNTKQNKYQKMEEKKINFNSCVSNKTKKSQDTHSSQNFILITWRLPQCWYGIKIDT